MKATIRHLLLAALLLPTLCLQPSAASAQGTAFIYQGRLDSGGAAASGEYEMSFSLFDAVTNGNGIGTTVTIAPLAVSNGLFTATLDFGVGAFDGAARWLEISVTVFGSDQPVVRLDPRQQITAVPYALHAGSASNLTGMVSVAQLPAGVVTNNGSGVALTGSFTGNGAGLANVNASSLGGLGSTGFWKTNGNTGANPTNGAFLGTTDDLPVEFRVNGVRALRLEPISQGVIGLSSAPNVIGGWAGNQVAFGAIGATLWGGGFDLVEDYGNIVGGDYGTVSGGRQNTADGAEAAVAGGRANTARGGNATISGGYANTADGKAATVAGGQYSTIEAGADYATIGGGSQNTIQSNATDTTIGGGANNTISSNGWRGTVGGGNANSVGAAEATVAGGAFNSALGFSSTIGGGGGNAASGEWSSIAGGRDNLLTNADYATIGGGVQNSIQTNSSTATISGGAYNVISSNAWRSTVGGGFANTISAPEGTVAGGAFNSALGFSSTIGGGGGNAASGEWSTIAGGRDNLLTSTPYATISGGWQNTIRSNVNYATIGGGWRNMIQPDTYAATIGGGVENTSQPSANYATIGGGWQNTIQAGAYAATIPGGFGNSAAGFAFAAGNRAKANHQGAFVWADFTAADFLSTAANQFSVRAAGGVRLETGGAGMTLDGVNVLSGIVPSASLAGTYSGAIVFNNSGNSFTGNGANLTTLNASQLASGTVPAAALGNAWRTGGNAGTTAGTHFLGTADNQPLEFKVWGLRALRLESFGNSPNLIGGHYLNSVSNGFIGASIVGGGSSGSPNRIGENYATVLGGEGNTAIGRSSTAMGFNTTARGPYSTAAGADTMASGNSSIAMGNTTTASGNYSAAMGNGTIASGESSTAFGWGARASALGATALGVATEASGERSTAAGFVTVASGFCATAFGRGSIAAGDYSFAGGYGARANHPGSFVWADSVGGAFASTGWDQFLIRASGGVGIGTGNPQGSLHVYSANNPTVVRVQSTGTPGFGRIEFVSNPQGDANEWRPAYIQSSDNGGFTGGLSFVVNGTGFDNRFAETEVMRIVNGRVGIGTPAPVSALQVVGTVTATAFNPPSDRNLKENFVPVSPRDVLEKVAAMPISRWNFKGDATTPHVGPMAQDFYAAFGIGTDERHIATVDADGVALAAIQGLNQKLEAEVKTKNARIAELERRLSAIETLLQR